MNKRKAIGIGLAVLALVVILALLFGSGQGEYNWKVNYKADSKQPYGTYVMYQLLNDVFPGKSRKTIRESIAKELPLDESGQSSFFFVGGNMFMDSADTYQLLNFVDLGNTAFISSEAIPYDLMFELYFEECYEDYPWDGYAQWNDTLIRPSLDHPSMTLDSVGIQLKHNFKTKSRGWSYIESDYFCNMEEGFTALGNFNEAFINFARIKYGSGYFYLHTTPLTLTNYYLIQPASQSYASSLLAHLQPGTIYWDEYSRVAGWRDPSPRNPRRNTADREASLAYVLSQPALAWSWWTLLGMGLLYLIFRARRRQEVIPVVEQNENTSLEFLQTVSQLSFMKNNHRLLADRLSQQWDNFVRTHFRLDLRKLEEPAFVQQLSAASQVAKADIEKILSLRLHYQRAAQITDRQLIDYYQLLETFYDKTR